MAGLTVGALWRLLGYPEGPGVSSDGGQLMSITPGAGAPGVLRYDLVIVGPRGPVPAIMLAPESEPDSNPESEPVPQTRARGAAVLYAHAHGNNYAIGKSEVLQGRAMIMDPPLGLALARAGHIVLAPDMPGFGARRDEGNEQALSKTALWQGRCLLGDMLADLAACFELLHRLPETAGRPVATLGLSMGATLAYWFAALEPRVAGAAHLCALADLDSLIATQAHDLHGIYMTVPSLLQLADMGDVAAMIAPRPQVIGAGLLDPLTPESALRPALDRVRTAYRGAPDRLGEVIDPDVGHMETPAMRAAVMAMLNGL